MSIYFKMCNFCFDIKPISYFESTDTASGGLHGFCRDCVDLQDEYFDKKTMKWTDKTIGNNINKHRQICKMLKARLKQRYKSAVPKEYRGDVYDMLGISIFQYKKYLEKFIKGNISWNNEDSWEIDHIEPIATFDLTKISKQRKCFNFTNTQLLLKSDHIIKTQKQYDK